ncbi:Zn-ribbon domain-containing protein [Methanocella sp. MCL-LM]|uniref:Zn-ribbon domain-containing protein n=1 Tax=Methanocella sp. MCL-LM TaxID=3412035 RepID=UPI003C77624A
MPHRCIDCKNIVDSGSIDLKMGCPVCGCKKFQYVRPKKEAKPPSSPTVAEYVAQAEKLARAELEANEAARENLQQIKEPSAKPEPKPPEPKISAAEGRQEGPRIESVRIIEPGTYDINLPVLMSRKELVMSKEEGSYFVDLPSALKAGKKGWRQKK